MIRFRRRRLWRIILRCFVGISVCASLLGAVAVGFGQIPDWDLVNGTQKELGWSTGCFLMEKGEGKYVPAENLPAEAIELVASGYKVDVPPGLDVRVVGVRAGLCDDGNGNSGIEIRAIILVLIPKDLSPDTRSIVLTFPNAIRARDLLHADSPSVAPAIEFPVRNFRTDQERAAHRWWLWLSLAILCLAGGFFCSDLVCVMWGEGGGKAALFGLALVVVGLWLLGSAIDDLRLIQGHAALIVSGSFTIPFFVLLWLFPQAWPIGLGDAAILAVIWIILRRGEEWPWMYVQSGALALLPGIAVSTVAGACRYLYKRKRGDHMEPLW